MTISKQFIKPLFIFLVGAILCYILVARVGCGAPIKNSPSLVSKLDSAKQILAAEKKARKKDDDSLQFYKSRIEYTESVTEDAVAITNQATKEAEDTRDKLAATQKELARYKAAHDTAGQLSACDTLTKQVTTERIKATKAEAACKTSINDYRELSKRKDDALAQQGKQLAKERAEFDKLYNTLKSPTLQPAKEPWVKGYIGAAAGIGGPGLLNNFGPELTFVFRNGVLAGVGGKIGNQFFADVRIAKLLSFKKR